MPASRLPRPPTRELLALRTVAQCLLAEIAACIASSVAMPRVRQAELFDALLPIVAEQQKAWYELPAKDRASLDLARARMLGALAGFEAPTNASIPARTRPHRPLAATPHPQARSSTLGRRSKWDI